MAAAGGLGDCGQDCEVCFWGTFCSTCLYGQIKARTGRAPSCWSGCMELTVVYVIASIVSQVVSGQMMQSAMTANDPTQMQEALLDAQTVRSVCSFLSAVSQPLWTLVAVLETA